jgi:hypothetical protein
MIPVWHGTVETNLRAVFVKYDAEISLGEYLKKLLDKRVDVTIRETKSKRSNNQNAYYWSVVLPILGDYFGYENDEVHFALRNKFLKKGACDLETARSTTSLNTAEFEDYLEKIRRWAITEYNINVPLPNEIEP